MKLTEVTHKQPEALTDEQWDTILVVLANAIRWSWVPTTTVMHMKAELARRPAPAPEPHQDDAAVVEEMLLVRMRDACWSQDDTPFDWMESMTHILALLRSEGWVPRTEGTYTLEEVVKAVRVYCVLQGWSLCVVNALIDDLRARLTAAPKPTKQDAAVEAVREVLAPYRNHRRPEIELSVFEDVVAAVRKADREAHNG